MYGKHFASTYTGSMFGAGSDVFAVWGYVIANTRDGQVELNPKLLASVIGSSEQAIISAMEYLCAVDPHSRNKTEDGRRLIREGEFAYRVPTYAAYYAIRNEDERREYNRVKKAQSRARAVVKAVNVPVIDGQRLSSVSANLDLDLDLDLKGAAPEVLPPDLGPTALARMLLDNLQFPITTDNVKAVAAAIECEVTAGKSGPSAYEFVLAGTLDAKDEGFEINRFFFADGKYRTERRHSNGRGQVSATAQRTHNTKRNIIDAFTRNARKASERDGAERKV